MNAIVGAEESRGVKARWVIVGSGIVEKCPGWPLVCRTDYLASSFSNGIEGVVLPY